MQDRPISVRVSIRARWMDLLTCSTRQNAPVEDLDIIIIGLLIIFTNYDHNETSEPKKKQSQIHQRQMDEDRT